MCVIVGTLVSRCASVRACLKAATQICQDRSVSLLLSKHRPTFLQLNKAATKERRYIFKSRADSSIQLVSFSIHYLFYSSLMNRLFHRHTSSTNSLSICLTSFLSFFPPLVPFLLSLLLFFFLPLSKTCCDSRD